MDKKILPDKPDEVPATPKPEVIPEKIPEKPELPEEDPEIIPEEDPDFIPEEDPYENPPLEVPPPGEGP